MKKFAVFAVSLGIVLLFSQNVFSQTGEELNQIRDEIKSLKTGQEGIKKDLQEIKKLLTSAPRGAPKQEAFKEAVINIENDPFKGDKNARVTLVDFSDYQ
jgi:septal ring factor EnvC (AmiA/AmiB activator)